MLHKGLDCPPELVRKSDRLEKTIKINMLVCARQGGQKNVTYCEFFRQRIASMRNNHFIGMHFQQTSQYAAGNFSAGVSIKFVWKIAIYSRSAYGQPKESPRWCMPAMQWNSEPLHRKAERLQKQHVASEAKTVRVAIALALTRQSNLKKCHALLDFILNPQGKHNGKLLQLQTTN